MSNGQGNPSGGQVPRRVSYAESARDQLVAADQVMPLMHRRHWLRSAAASTVGGLWYANHVQRGHGDDPWPKLPVAAVVTVYQPHSHADVIVGKILEGYRQDGGEGPRLRLVSLYTDQVPNNDMSRALAEKHGFRIARSIDEALTGGTDALQVAGVLSIGEHGNYPFDPVTHQHLYPRRQFFNEIIAAFRRCGATVPVFNDKHLSYRWQDARDMFDISRSMRFPLMAGSSVPVAWRYPALELPLHCDLEAALTVGYGGLESYGFHALEAHQCMVERRQGGEAGIVEVQAVQGDAIREAERQGRWSPRLLAAALATAPAPRRPQHDWTQSERSAVYLLKHRDGLESAVVMASGFATQFAGAYQLRGEPAPRATWFKLQEDEPFGHFAYLVHAVDTMMHTGREPYPVERTLLTTGILARVMESLARGGEPVATPELDIAYTAREWPFANHPRSPFTLPND